MLGRFDQVVHSVAEAMGCTAEVNVKRLTPAVTNNKEVTRHIQGSAQSLLPDADLDTSPYLTMGAEDMAFMLEQIPGCYFFVGSAAPEKGLDYGHHHPKFDFDESALPRAVAWMAGSISTKLAE